ncbi:MSHA biogenesis protein MshP [Parashewanella curva]|uniref:MSHA biogenesis protein MshP n=1 Tax=Parashewanella curva TaxID=2338552 RepID=A0A3L8PUD3_9GAMM|nr:MSHA biogenesis protein MshP [Parashewanella curva]RLV59035.1 MSHA biogenesis protein MshP [Parashewanella curva]
MFHKNNSLVNRSKQRGSMLVLGIFILTIMFLLAATLINVSQNEDQAITIEVQGARALFAANSALDAGLAQLFPTDGSLRNCTNVSTSWSNNDIALQACPVTLTCQSYTVANVGTQFRLTAKAICGNDTPNRVSRTVEVMAR